MPIAIGTKLGRYEIRSKVGEGGMGEVYLAQDTKLDRKIALKILPAEVAPHRDRMERFVREAKAAAALNHPNIAHIYEISEADGVDFIAMEYVEGETLQARIKRNPVELKEALAIATQIAEGLSEAHAQGIVHRDIKPGNIMITARGRVKVMDFGLAKVIEAEEAFNPEAETRNLLTSPGAIIGTMPYMSPEQVKGERLDARTDIFSFGVVLYEILTGQQLFVAPSGAATISAILTKEPPPLSQYLAQCSNELQRIVRKCLEKERERRYQTMLDVAIDLDSCRKHEVARDSASQSNRTTQGDALTATSPHVSMSKSLVLRRSLMVGVPLALVVAAALVYVFVLPRATTTARAPEIKSLAVLPLENLSGDPAQDYFADGMTDAIISNLTQIQAFNKVISRQSIMRYKGSRKSLPEIANELNVDALIEGTVQRSGGRVRVAARLIPAAADSPSWSRDYERDESDVLKLESEVARAVADEIRIHVTADERARLASARSVNPQAQEAYLLGRYHLSKVNEQDVKEAVEYFQRAIQIAPDYAAAYAGLADAYLAQGFTEANMTEVESLALSAALKAIELDDQLAEAHIALANIKLYYLEWTTAERELKRALELNPGSVDAHIYYGLLVSSLGRHDEAIKEGQIAVQLDPLSAGASLLGRFLIRAKRYQEALPYLLRGVELEPRSARAYFRLGDNYVQLGRYDEAIATYQKAGAKRVR
jgi:serine/threonine-protein kinase